MAAGIITVLIGLICIIISISNMRGNISSLHSYHRSRVAPEDVPQFGKLVGIGTAIIGASVIAMGGLTILAIQFERSLYSLIGTVILTVGLIVGIIITFYAMKKYNKGIF